MIQKGIIVSQPRALIRGSQTATLTGLILGDGNIHRFPRTEKLTITLGTDKPKLIDYAEKMVSGVFRKTPITSKIPNTNAVRITLYQKDISNRIAVPTGKRRYSTMGIPAWILEKDEILIACLKGLYEAEASLCIHLPTCTYNFSFHNRNQKLLSDVSSALARLGYHPEIRSYAIRLRKRNEVKLFKEQINFRVY